MSYATGSAGNVLTGAGPLLRGQPVPTFLKVLASPIGALIVRMPQSRGVQQPALYVCGTGDPESTVDRVKQFVGMLPRAELDLIDGGGHLPWLDDPSQVGARIGRLLTA